jgi:signal transduction histidine kinase
MPHRDEENGAVERSSIAKMFAHDFKNPISALSANLSYLQAVMAEADEDMRGAVDDSVFAIGVLLHLIDNYVTIARLEGGERLETSSVPLRQFVDSVLKSCRGLVSSGEVRLLLEGDVPDVICEWELAYATFVVKNLLVASATYSAGGGEVRLRVSVDVGVVRFSVADTGTPVSGEFRRALFTRDTQVRAKSLVGSRYARGLGLYAVGIGAGFLGGEAAVAEVDGRDAFVVSLPIEEAP